MGDKQGHPFRGNQYTLVKTGGGDAGTFSSRTPARVPNEYEVQDAAGNAVGLLFSHRDPDFPKANVRAWTAKKHDTTKKFQSFTKAKEWVTAPENLKADDLGLGTFERKK